MSFIGAERVFETHFIALLRYDEELHRLAIIKEENLGPRAPATVDRSGLQCAFNTIVQHGNNYYSPPGTGRNS